MIDRYDLTKTLADICNQDFREVQVLLEPVFGSMSLIRRADVWAAFLAGLSASHDVLGVVEQRWEKARRLRRTCGLNEVQKKRIYLRDEGRCRYCGKSIRRGTRYMEVAFDHVNPWSQGGRNKDENIVLACRGCNALKGARTPEQAGMPILPPVGGVHAP